MKKATIAALAMTILGLSTSMASAQLCTAGVIAMAIYANASDGRELTAKEAATCGLLYGTEETKAKPAKKKVARQAKNAAKAKAQ